MKTDFGTIDGIATVADALRKMKLLKTAVLIVNKRNENDEYGMVTSGDIARHVLARDRAPDRRDRHGSRCHGGSRWHRRHRRLRHTLGRLPDRHPRAHEGTEL